MSPEQLEEWGRLANEATEGPWFIDDRILKKELWVVTGDIEKEVPPIAVVTDKKDKFFIAAAREAVPALIARVRELEEEADWLATQLAKFDTCPNEMLEEDVDCFLRCKRNMYTKPCWRAYAEKAEEYGI